MLQLVQVCAQSHSPPFPVLICTARGQPMQALFLGLGDWRQEEGKDRTLSLSCSALRSVADSPCNSSEEPASSLPLSASGRSPL